jgi:hypothetical protein
MLAVPGEIVMEVSVGEPPTAETVSVAVPLTPVSAAVIALDPAATPVASPPALIVATDVLALVHVAVEVTSAVDPSL